MRLVQAILCLAVLGGEALAQQESKPDAAKLVRAIRYSQAAHSFDLDGEITKKRKGVPFRMSMIKELDMIRFRFNDPVQVISLELKDNRYRLTEQLAGQKNPKELEEKRYTEKVRGTDVTYEDISQRYLYWPSPKIVGEEKLRLIVLRDTWIVQLNNPRRELGSYAAVRVWIDKESNALLQVEGINSKGQKVKRFRVRSIQKDKEVGVWLLDKMRVEVLNHEGRGSKETTYMRMDKPVRRK